MSIDVNWETATSGPDGAALAERIRSFIHDKFQQVALPRFIRSVQVHSFDFGTIAPELEIKDFCEPFADFYEEDEDESGSSESSEAVHEEQEQEQRDHWPGPVHHSHFDSRLDDDPSQFRNEMAMSHLPQLRDNHSELQSPSAAALRSPMSPHFLPRTGTPCILGGTSNLGHHLMGLGGLSGTQTPLAAVAGGTPFASGWSDSGLGSGIAARPERVLDPSSTIQQQQLQESDVDMSPPSRPSSAKTPPSPPSIGHNPGSSPNGSSGQKDKKEGEQQQRQHAQAHLDASPTAVPPLHPPPRMRERRPEDFQVICHVKYAGDVRLCLTAEILLDYPMPSFVGLPLKLNVTGLTFDGVAILAYIRRRVHFCFLSAEDAYAMVGSDEQEHGNDEKEAQAQARTRTTGGGDQYGGLLREIRVDSEIGRKEDGKQVLKNVGKVERFVLAQVRRIFEEELVFPSFWTFLI
ncbi:Mitochondrial distribution and morphology protein 12 [Monascus purpureus]|uniref:Mitochondrial distribution and morphology protein 12 n=1 Tax=Monascus purpureus TaxID=5098 RepID=A0A507QQK4_MONPU|nr:Mitochondrial distribution and morphology protein 12 [Monascus purpureus]